MEEDEAMRRRIEERILQFVFEKVPNDIKAEVTLRTVNVIIKEREKREKKE